MDFSIHHRALRHWQPSDMVVRSGRRVAGSAVGGTYKSVRPNAAAASGGKTTTRKRTLRAARASIVVSSQPADAALPSTNAAMVPTVTSITPVARRHFGVGGGVPMM